MIQEMDAVGCTKSWAGIMAPDHTLEVALEHYQQGKLSEAEGMLKQLLRLHPGNPDVHHLLAVIALQTDRASEASDYLKTAVSAAPASTELYILLGNALQKDGQFDEACEAMKKAVSISPNISDNHYNLGNMLRQMRRFEESVGSYNKAIALEPDFADAHFNLGLSLNTLGRLDEAADAYRQVITININDAEAHNNLGVILKNKGDLSGAENCYKRALTIEPLYAEANLNIGNIQEARNQHLTAEKSYRQAIKASPNMVEAHFGLGAVLHNLQNHKESLVSWQRVIKLTPENPAAFCNQSIVLRSLGRSLEAFHSARQALTLSPKSIAFWREWVDCIYWSTNIPMDPQLVREIEAFLELGIPGVDKLRNYAQDLILQNPDIQDLIKLCKAGDTVALADRLINGTGFRALSTPLFSRLISRLCISRIQIETLLTMARRVLLRLALERKFDYVITKMNGTDFLYALAKQCFLNNYVFQETDEEAIQANALENAANESLSTNAAVNENSIVLLACYCPLDSLINTAALLEKNNSSAFAELLIQQVKNPLEEQRIRTQIPKITEITDPASKITQQHYEGPPHPRWVDSRIISSDSMRENLCHTFPYLLDMRIGWPKSPKILVAGCGSGRQPIKMARQYNKSQVLAVDLSLPNLAYGERKRREHKAENIEFMQADILELGKQDRRFNIIQCSGVLHQMDDPMVGWRVLRELLVPHGFMLIGIYSEHARKDIVTARAYVRENWYGSTPKDIRKCRKDIIALPDEHPDKALEKWPDFFNTSACRDLLFHKQVHRFTLPQIAVALEELNLKFIGFNNLDRRVCEEYQDQFPDDKNRVNLANWDIYERENPDTFAHMYQFWAFKPNN